MHQISFFDRNKCGGLYPTKLWKERLIKDNPKKGKANITKGLFSSSPKILPFNTDCIPRIVPHPGQYVPVILYQGQGGK